MCPHLRSAESRLRRRTMKRPRPQQSPQRGRLALSVANRGLRCEFFSAGAEVGKVFARAEIRKAAREVMSSSATNAPRSPRRSLRGPSLSPRNLTRLEILLPHSESTWWSVSSCSTNKQRHCIYSYFLSMASLKSEASFALRIGKRTRGVRSVHRTIVQQNAE